MSTPEDQITGFISLDDYEAELARQFGVPLAIAKAARGLESGNKHIDPKTGTALRSWKNARGRYQVVPSTAKGIDPTADPNDIWDNTYLGIKYLADGYKEAEKYADIDEDSRWGAALVHYHGGPGGLKYAHETGRFRSDAKPGRPETGMDSFKYASTIMARAHQIAKDEMGYEELTAQPQQQAPVPQPTWASPHQAQQQQVQQPQPQAQQPQPAQPQQQGVPQAPRTEQERQQLIKQLKDRIVVPSVVLPEQREAWKQGEFDRQMQAAKEGMAQPVPERRIAQPQLPKSLPPQYAFGKMLGIKPPDYLMQQGQREEQDRIDAEIRDQSAKRLLIAQDPGEREKLLANERAALGTGADRLVNNIKQGFSTMGRSRLLGVANKLNYWGSSEDIARSNADREARQRALEAKYYLTAAADPSISGDVTRALGTVASDMMVIAPLAAATGGIGGAAGLTGLAATAATGAGSMLGTAALSDWQKDPWGSAIETAVSPLEVGAGGLGRRLAAPLVGRLENPTLKWLANRMVGTVAGGIAGGGSEAFQEVPSSLYSILAGDMTPRQAGRNIFVSGITGAVMGNLGGGISPEHMHAQGTQPSAAGTVPVVDTGTKLPPGVTLPPGTALPPNLLSPDLVGPVDVHGVQTGPEMRVGSDGRSVVFYGQPSPPDVDRPLEEGGTTEYPTSTGRVFYAPESQPTLPGMQPSAVPGAIDVPYIPIPPRPEPPTGGGGMGAGITPAPVPGPGVSVGPDFIRTPGAGVGVTPTPQPRPRPTPTGPGPNDVPDIEPETIDSVLPPEQRTISDTETPRLADKRHGGDIASSIGMDLPWFNDASRSVLLDTDFRASLRRNLEDMLARGEDPRDNNDNPITHRDIVDLTERVPWEIRPDPVTGLHTPEVQAQRKKGIEQGFIKARAAIRAIMRDRLAPIGADIRSINQLRASDWVDYFNENIPRQSKAWQKLRVALEGNGIDMPEHAKTTGAGAPGRGAYEGIPAHLDISSELDTSLSGQTPRTPEAKIVKSLVGNDPNMADAFAEVYAKTAREAAARKGRGQTYSHLPANLRDMSKLDLLTIADKQARPILMDIATKIGVDKANRQAQRQAASKAKGTQVKEDMGAATTKAARNVRTRRKREGKAPTTTPAPTTGEAPTTRPDMSRNVDFDFEGGRSTFLNSFKPKQGPPGGAAARPPKAKPSVPEPDMQQMMHGLYQMAGALVEAGKHTYADFSDAIKTEAGPYADYIARHIPLVYRQVRIFGEDHGRHWGPQMSADEEIEAHISGKPVIAKVRSTAAIKAERGKAAKAQAPPKTVAAATATVRSQQSQARATAALQRVAAFTQAVPEDEDIVPSDETLARLPTDRLRELRKETITEIKQSRQVLDEEQRGAGGDTAELERYIANLEESLAALDKRLNIDSMREGRPTAETKPKTQKQRIVSYVKKKADKAAAPAAVVTKAAAPTAVATKAAEPTTAAEIDARMDELEQQQRESEVRLAQTKDKKGKEVERAIYNSIQVELERLSKKAAALEGETPPPTKVPVKKKEAAPAATTTPAVTKPKETPAKGKKKAKPTAASVEADQQVIAHLESGNKDLIDIVRGMVDAGQEISPEVVAALEKAEGKTPAVPIDEGGPLTIDDQIAAPVEETTPESVAVTPTPTPTVKKPGGIIQPKGQYVRPATRIVRAPKDVPLPRRQRPTATPEQIDALNQELKAATQKRLQLAEEGKTVGKGLGWEEAVKLKVEHRQKLTAAKAEEARLATAIGAAQGIVGATPTSAVEITKTATKPPPAEATAAEPALPSRRTEPVSEEERAAGRARLTELEIDQLQLADTGNRLMTKLNAQLQKQADGDTSEQLTQDIAFTRSQITQNGREVNATHMEAQRVALSTGAPAPAAPGRVIEEGMAKGEMTKAEKAEAERAREMHAAFIKATTDKEANEKARQQAADVVRRLEEEQEGKHTIGPTGKEETPKERKVRDAQKKQEAIDVVADLAHKSAKSKLDKLRESRQKPSGSAARPPAADIDQAIEEARQRRADIVDTLREFGQSYMLRGVRGFAGWSDLMSTELGDYANDVVDNPKQYYKEVYGDLRDLVFKKEKKQGFSTDEEIDAYLHPGDLTERIASEAALQNLRKKMRDIDPDQIEDFKIEESIAKERIDEQRETQRAKAEEQREAIKSKYKGAETSHKLISRMYEAGEESRKARGHEIVVAKYPPYIEIKDDTEMRLEILLRRGEILPRDVRKMYLDAWRNNELSGEEILNPVEMAKLVDEEAEWLSQTEQEGGLKRSFAITEEAEAVSRKRLEYAAKEKEGIVQKSKNVPSLIQRQLALKHVVEKLIPYLNRREIAEAMNDKLNETRPADPFRAETVPLNETPFGDLPPSNQMIIQMYGKNLQEYHNELAAVRKGLKDIEDAERGRHGETPEEGSTITEAMKTKLQMGEKVLVAQIDEARRQISLNSTIPGKQAKAKPGRPSSAAVLEKEAMQIADLETEVDVDEEAAAIPVTREDKADIVVLSSLKEEATKNLTGQEAQELASREQRTQSELDKQLVSRFAKERTAAVEKLEALSGLMRSRINVIEKMIDNFRKQGATEEGVRPFVQGVHALATRAHELETRAQQAMKTRKRGKGSLSLPEEQLGEPVSEKTWADIAREAQEVMDGWEEIVKQAQKMGTAPKVTPPASRAEAKRMLTDSQWRLRRPVREHLIPRLWTNTPGMSLVLGLTRNAPGALGIALEFHEVENDVIKGMHAMQDLDAQDKLTLKYIERQLRDAMESSRQRGYNSIVLMDTEMGVRFGGQVLRTTVRHESVHGWQAKHARPKGLKPGMLTADQIKTNPLYDRMERALIKRDYWTNSQGKMWPNMVAAEGMAHILSGQGSWLDLSEREQARWLHDTFSQIEKGYGSAALDDLLRSVPLARQELAERTIASVRTKGRQNTALDNARRTPQTTAGPTPIGRGGITEPGTGNLSVPQGQEGGGPAGSRAGDTRTAQEDQGRQGPGVTTRAAQQRATADVIRQTFPRSNWGQDVAPTNTNLKVAQDKADFQPVGRLATHGVQAVQGNQAMTQILGAALGDLGYHGVPNAVGFPKVFLTSIASQLRHYGDIGTELADHLDTLRQGEMYGDRVAYFNTSRQIPSDQLYNAVLQEFGNQFLSDVTDGKVSPWDGGFVSKDKAYEHVRAGMANLLGDPDITDADVERHAPGFILAGNWKELGFKTQAQSLTFLKRYARQLAQDYGLAGIQRWPLSQPSAQADTLSTIVREVQSEKERTTQAKEPGTQPAASVKATPAGQAGPTVLPAGGTGVSGGGGAGTGQTGGRVVSPTPAATTTAPGTAATTAPAKTGGGHTVATGVGGKGPQVVTAAPIPTGIPASPPAVVTAATIPAPGTPAHGALLSLAKKIFFPKGPTAGSGAGHTSKAAVAGGGFGQGSGANPRGSRAGQQANVVQQAQMLVSVPFMLGNLGTVVASTGFEGLLNSPATATVDAILSLARKGGRRTFLRRRNIDYLRGAKLFKQNEASAPPGYRLIGFNLAGTPQAGTGGPLFSIPGVGLPSFLTPAFEPIPPSVFTSKALGTPTEKALYIINQYPDMVGFTMHFYANSVANVRLLEQQSNKSGIAISQDDLLNALSAAHMEAEYQSLRQANAFSATLRGIKDFIGWLPLRAATKGQFPFHKMNQVAIHLGDFLGNVKFTQVPGAMMQHAWNKSPLGLISAASKGLKSITAYKLGDPMAKHYEAQAIRATMEALMGTGVVMAPFVLLGYMNLTVPSPKDYEEEEMLRAMGKTPYATNWTRVWKWIASGFDSRELEWKDDDAVRRYSHYVSPHGIASDIASEIGHALRRAHEGKDVDFINMSMKAVMEALDSFSDLTAGGRVLQDIGKAYKESDSFLSGAGAAINTIAQNVVATALSFPAVTQPWQLLGDKTKREYRQRGEKGSVKGELKEYLSRVQARTPYFSKNLPARLNALGETQEQYPNATLGDLLQPGKNTRYKKDELLEEMVRLEKAPHYLRPKEGETYESVDQRSMYRGSRIRQYGSQLIMSGTWAAASDDERKYLFQELYDRAVDPHSKLSVSALRDSLKAHRKHERSNP